MNRFVWSVYSKRRTLSIFLIVLILSWVGTGCSSNQKEPTSSNSWTFEDNLALISSERMLASINNLADSGDGRISGFDNETKAGAYIKNAFKEAGLEVSEQEFPIKAYQCTGFEISINTGVKKVLKDAMVLNYSGATPKEGLEAEIIFAGPGSAADYKDKDVSGKYVLIQRGGELFRTKVARAADEGAAGAIFYDPNGAAAISATLGELSDIPAACISQADALIILDQIMANKKVTANLIVESISKDSVSKNIIGTLKSVNNPTGSVLVVGAHYDSVNTHGANDNASGVAAIIEMAKVINELKKPLNCDIQFVAFGAEEIGLLGSIAYVDNMFIGTTKKPIAMLNFDMVGVGETVYVYSATNQLKSPIQDISGKALDQLSYDYEMVEMDNSDHVPFAMSGVQSLLFENGPYEDYHTPKDTADGINPDALNRIANTGVAICLAVGENPDSIIQNK